LISRVHTFIVAHQLILPGDTIAAAVSGGVDSMVMLDILLRLRSELPFDLRVIHINHGIRGSESDLDQTLVEEICTQNQLPFFSEKLRGFSGNSSEESLREARYAVFEAYLERIAGGKIATAHHLDDRMETFFMRLARGSGVKGLRSIPVRRGPYIRPLLFLRREEIHGYAERHHIPYRVDSTNKDRTKLRNNIRETLTPVLLDVFGKDFYRGFTKSLQDLDEIYAIYEDENRKLFSEMIEKEENRLKFRPAQYKSLPTRQRRHLLEYCISYFYPLNFGFAETYFKEFDKFTEKAQTGAVFHFDYNIRVFKERDHIVFHQDETAQFKPLQLSAPDSVTENRVFKFSIKRLAGRPTTLKKENPFIEIICGDRLFFPLQIRGWQEGDWFYPLGMNKKQKLSDFFINQKIERLDKKHIPLLVNRDEIVWVAGLRLDHRYRVQKECKTLYEVEVIFKQAN